MKRLGWHTPSINTNGFPHEQFYYLTKKKLYKIDAVYSIVFGESKMKYKYEENVLDTKEYRDGIFVPSFSHSVLTLALHILYDKGVMQEHNKARLLWLLKQEKTYDIFITEKILQMFSELLDIQLGKNSSHEVSELKSKYKSDLNEVLEENKENPIYLFLFNIKCHFRSIIYRLKKSDIAIIGVDGSGKSSCIERLKQIKGFKLSTQYMGYRGFHTQCDDSGSTAFSVLRIYREMWQRYLKNRFNYGGVVVYDRYPYEIYLNATGIRRCFYTFLYRWLFPKPKKVIYIHCMAETSLTRKSDITNENVFRKMKERFDKSFLNQRAIDCYSSDELSVDEIVGSICNSINDVYYEFLA